MAFGASDADAKRSHKHSHHKRLKPRIVIVKPEPIPKTPPIPLLTRAEILAAEPARLERMGRRLVVGYESYAEVKALVEKKAIAGVFITDHNVRRRKPTAVKADIDALQAIRATQGLPPLIVAADQEGGTVSRLSPPLKSQPSLARILTANKDDAARKDAVEKFAAEQAAELKRLGVTLNFSPVVDLNIDPDNRDDGETRLNERAIAADPYVVGKVAGWYCDALAKADMTCTLKHFPGLGRVKRDTHVTSGEIAASESELELNDWYPFRHVMDRSNAVTMLGHVRVTAIDKTTPASYSDAIIRSLIRERWRCKGLLITDDFSMGAVTRSADGVGGAAVKAISAGADLVLVSFSEQHYNAAMSALLRADEEGVFAADDGAGTRARIVKAFGHPDSAAR